MKLVVDQSIKIGDTQSPTVLALSNDIQRAILIPASVKRECIRALRGRWTPDATLYIRLFAAGLFLLLRELLTTADRITIDVEYPGHERDIKRDLLLLCRQAGDVVDPSVIHFEHIGKKVARALSWPEDFPRQASARRNYHDKGTVGAAGEKVKPGTALRLVQPSSASGGVPEGPWSPGLYTF